MMKKSLVFVLLVGFFSCGQLLAETFNAHSIRIEGLRRISKDAVLQAFDLKMPAVIDEKKSTEIIQALFKTGFFQDVKLEKEGQILVAKLKERPTIEKLTLTGIREKDKITKILKEKGLAEGRVFNPTALGAAQKELEQYYLARGRYGVRIEPTIKETEDKINLQIAIFEGDMARIREIKIVGNKAFKVAALLKDLHLSTTNWLSWYTHDDQYSKEKLNADLESIRSYYMDRGYINFQIDSTQVSLSSDKKYVYITINVTEGDVFSIGQTTISGNFPGIKNKMEKVLSYLKTGTTFSRKNILEVKQALEDKLGSEGYSFAEVRPNTEVDVLKKQVHIDFHLVPAKLVYVRQIHITGNTTTQDEVVRRELPQMEGTWIATDLIKEGKTYILRRGFATNVEVETIPLPNEADKVDVLYKIEEAKVREFSASIGYSPTERFMFRLGLSQQNFLGTGKTIDFMFDNSRANTTYKLGYLDPFFTIDGIGLGANAYFSKTDLSNATNVTDYSTDALGVDANWIFPISKHEVFRILLGYNHTHLKVDPLREAEEVRSFVNRHGKRYVEYLTELGWGFDTLDRHIMPTTGMSQNLSMRLALPNSKLNYYRVNYEGNYYQPIKGDFILNLTGAAGFGNGYGKSKRLPFFKNFYAGGIGSVRGFRENSLGPKDSRGSPFGGNAMVSGTAAVIFPNPIKPDAKTIRTSVFFDVGQVFDTRNKSTHKNIGGLRYSTGLALSWQTPLGSPLIISIARPLNLKHGDSKKGIAVTFGTQL